jgi:hypothetical protein
VFAKYQINANTCNLLIVEYNSEVESKEAYNNFIKIYLPEGANTGKAKLENKKWTSTKIIKNYFLAIFDSPEAESADNLLSKINIK